MRSLLVTCFVAVLISCSPDSETVDTNDLSVAQTLEQRVTAAVTAASDLPTQNLSVSVQGGLVTISGSLDCEDCGGYRTPGQAGTVQQSLGAVVRAVPGVDEVRFELQIPD